MATIASLTSLIVEQTRRPEIPAVTLAALKAAVLRAHHTDFFPRDIRTSRLVYSVPAAVPAYQDFPNISTQLPGLRNFDAVIGVDAVTSVEVEKLEYRELQDRHQADGTQRISMYNLLGDTLRCYFKMWTGALDVYYYKNPLFTSTDVTSWIVETYPDEIVSWAAGIVFARTGFTEQAQAYQELHVKPFKELLINSHLLGEVN